MSRIISKRKKHVPALLSYASPGDPLLKRFIIQSIEVASGRRRLERLYDEVRDLAVNPSDLWEAVLRKLQIAVDYDEHKLQKTPLEGPVVFIANHPFGVVDGLILGFLVSRIRKKFCVLVNEVLCRDDQLSQFLLPIDFRPTREALATNLESRRRTLERLKAGEALAIFPAGGVATTAGIGGPLQDLEWKRFVVKVIQQSRATVVPLYVHGRNSTLFQVASQISLPLRLSLLLHEVNNKVGRRIRVEIGDPISYEQLAAIDDRQAMLDFLRQTTWGLGGKHYFFPEKLPKFLRSKD